MEWLFLASKLIFEIYMRFYDGTGGLLQLVFTKITNNFSDEISVTFKTKTMINEVHMRRKINPAFMCEHPARSSKKLN